MEKQHKQPNYVNQGVIYGVMLQSVVTEGTPKDNNPNLWEIADAVANQDELVMSLPIHRSISYFTVIGYSVRQSDILAGPCYSTNGSHEVQVMKYDMIDLARVTSNMGRGKLEESLRGIGVRDEFFMPGGILDNITLYNISSTPRTPKK